jgi:multidrug efflux pump subunit AcrB
VNLADLALRNRTTTLVLTAVLIIGGASAFSKLSRLEDPEFTIKEALVVTPYPGASATEVEEEVSDLIERAVQQLGQLKEVESKNDRGLSTVTVRIKDQYDKHSLPQVWDELRRKVNDVQGQLPPGAGPSIVNDDYGDVWGVFIAIYGDEYTNAELKDYAKLLRRELLLVKDVAKIEFWGERREVVYIIPNRDRMSQLGVQPQQIIDSLHDKNVVVDSGRARVGKEFLAIDPTGTFQSVRAFGELRITGQTSGQQIYLRDVADVRRGYKDPPDKVLRYDGQTAIGFGVSTVSGGNVVDMGDALHKRILELLPQTPLGIDVGIISLQSTAVTKAINNFMMSLLEAVAIVIVVLLAFMGLRSGLLIGFILFVTIAGTFIFMGPWHVALERISLGALIIALGMLVDNAIVVVDGILVRLQRNITAEDAAREVCRQNAMPLLGATAVAIMAFGAIGLSDDSTGEFCRSLFQVVFLSLGLSWVTAMTVTPVLGVMFLKAPKVKEGEGGRDPYGGMFYTVYRAILTNCIRFRWLTLLVVAGLFALSVWGFRFVDNSFFPNSTRPQFIVDFWLPEGTHIDETVRTAADVEKYLLGLDNATHVTTLAGAGAMRFLVTYGPEKPDSSYAQFLVDVEDYEFIDQMIAQIERESPERFPGALVYAKKFLLGPGSGGRIQARFSGRDANELRRLSQEAMKILMDDGDAKAIRTDWRQRTMIMRPVMAEEEANRAGIGRPDVARTIKAGFEGLPLGVYREGDELLPIVLRAEKAERDNVASIQNLQVWSPVARQAIPLRQVVSDFRTVFEDGIIQRLNRKTTITVHADPSEGVPSELLARVKPRIEALKLPPGYELEWWGEYRDSGRARAGIAASIPFFFAAMVLITIALFNALRQPLAIWSMVPLALIGVTAGLLLTRQPFGFMALLGFMSLSGMLIKNAIVLIDEIEIQKREGLAPLEAIITSGVSRLRPVAMAALTTALGMIPLLFDAFFVAMAVTIIFGLMVATFLTMLVLPVVFAALFRVPFEAESAGPPTPV